MTNFKYTKCGKESETKESHSSSNLKKPVENVDNFIMIVKIVKMSEMNKTLLW